MWSSSVLYLIVIVLVTVWFYKYATYKPKNFPPGPPRLPIWGSYPFLLLLNWNYPHLVSHKMRKIFGNLIGLHLGDQLAVVCCDYETSKEVLLRPEFDGKPDIELARARTPKRQLQGIFFVDGPFWHEQRRFALRHLRDHGFGRRFQKLETLMEEQIQAMIDFINNAPVTPEDNDILQPDRTILLPDLLYPFLFNSIMSTFGLAPAIPGSPRYRALRDFGRTVKAFQQGLFVISTVNITPWMRFIVPRISGYQSVLDANDNFFPAFRKIIEEMKQTKINEEEARHFYDKYLNKITESEQGEKYTFTEDQLLMLSIDVMFPAISTISETFIQIVFSLMHHTEIRTRMQAEIDEVVGRGRLPTLDDRKNMPYTEAILREVMRKESLIPLGIPHRALKDTTLKGYDIPKNTIIVSSIYSAHMDEKVWGDPKNFRPERFLTPTGDLVKKDQSFPFSAGKRICMGETFARNTLFLLTTCFYQNFSFEMRPGVKLPNMENKYPGMIVTQKDICWIRAISRN